MDLALLIITNLITGVSCTLLGVWLSTIALNLEFVRTRIEEETTVDNLDVPGGGSPTKTPFPTKKRKFGYRDVLLGIVIVGFMATGINQISVGQKAAEASEDATMAVSGLRDSNRCLTRYSNSLADALDRRQADNVTFQETDAERDRTLLALAATDFTSRQLLTQLGKDTGAKQAALEKIKDGRAEKSYPQAPRDACK